VASVGNNNVTSYELRVLNGNEVLSVCTVLCVDDNNVTSYELQVTGWRVITI
jgi:hypothetical protein